MNTVLCSVSGFQNKEGKTQIKNALNKIKRVSQVGVNFVTDSIQIKYNEPAAETELKNCIENTGFRVEYE